MASSGTRKQKWSSQVRGSQAMVPLQPAPLHGLGAACVEQEDATLKKLVDANMGADGAPSWGEVAREMAVCFPAIARSTKACRERWFHHLRPGLTDAEWTPAEEVVLFQLQALHGNRWTAIAVHLPGRSDQNAKNRYYAALRRVERQRKLNRDAAMALIAETYLPGAEVTEERLSTGMSILRAAALAEPLEGTSAAQDLASLADTFDERGSVPTSGVKISLPIVGIGRTRRKAGKSKASSSGDAPSITHGPGGAGRGDSSGAVPWSFAQGGRPTLAPPVVHGMGPQPYVNSFSTAGSDGSATRQGMRAAFSGDSGTGAEGAGYTPMPGAAYGVYPGTQPVPRPGVHRHIAEDGGSSTVLGSTFSGTQAPAASGALAVGMAPGMGSGMRPQLPSLVQVPAWQGHRRGHSGFVPGQTLPSIGISGGQVSFAGHGPTIATTGSAGILLSPGGGGGGWGRVPPSGTPAQPQPRSGWQDVSPAGMAYVPDGRGGFTPVTPSASPIPPSSTPLTGMSGAPAAQPSSGHSLTHGLSARARRGLQGYTPSPGLSSHSVPRAPGSGQRRGRKRTAEEASEGGSVAASEGGGSYGGAGMVVMVPAGDEGAATDAGSYTSGARSVEGGTGSYRNASPFQPAEGDPAHGLTPQMDAYGRLSQGRHRRRRVAAGEGGGGGADRPRLTVVGEEEDAVLAGGGGRLGHMAPMTRGPLASPAGSVDTAASTPVDPVPGQRALESFPVAGQAPGALPETASVTPRSTDSRTSGSASRRRSGSPRRRPSVRTDDETLSSQRSAGGTDRASGGPVTGVLGGPVSAVQGQAQRQGFVPGSVMNSASFAEMSAGPGGFPGAGGTAGHVEDLPGHGAGSLHSRDGGPGGGAFIPALQADTPATHAAADTHGPFSASSDAPGVGFRPNPADGSAGLSVHHHGTDTITTVSTVASGSGTGSAPAPLALGMGQPALIASSIHRSQGQGSRGPALASTSQAGRGMGGGALPTVGSMSTMRTFGGISAPTTASGRATQGGHTAGGASHGDAPTGPEDDSISVGWRGGGGGGGAVMPGPHATQAHPPAHRGLRAYQTAPYPGHGLDSVVSGETEGVYAAGARGLGDVAAAQVGEGGSLAPSHALSGAVGAAGAQVSSPGVGFTGRGLRRAGLSQEASLGPGALPGMPPLSPKGGGASGFMAGLGPRRTGPVRQLRGAGSHAYGSYGGETYVSGEMPKRVATGDSGHGRDLRRHGSSAVSDVSLEEPGSLMSPPAVGQGGVGFVPPSSSGGVHMHPVGGLGGAIVSARAVGGAEAANPWGGEESMQRGFSSNMRSSAGLSSVFTGQSGSLGVEGGAKGEVL